MTAFVIPTRTDSSRLPNKPFLKINGEPIIELLIKRLQKLNVPIFLAVPKEQASNYEHLTKFDNVRIHASKHHQDPLKRMHECAKVNGIDTIIRVSHDKILIEEKDLKAALHDFETLGFDYVYGSKFTAGTGFEIIKFSALEKAASKFKKVEYIGFAIRKVTDKVYDYNPRHQRGGFRFLIDYESDLKMFQVLFSQVGNDASLSQCMKYLTDNPEIKEINKLPLLTIYTCVKNGEKWIERCMDSIARQKYFKDHEYIIVDDFSTDKTCEQIAKFSLKHKNVSWFRNDENIGLSSSSNLVLKKARGKYILRLDADDYFVNVTSLQTYLKEIQDREVEALYPNNYFGSLNTIQKGNEKHHAGGTIFLKDAINHIKFTDGLKHHDSLDVFSRAKDILKIGYLDRAMFFYTQRKDSMSKSDLKEREEIKEKILTRLDGLDFMNEEEELDTRSLYLEHGVDIEPSH